VIGTTYFSFISLVSFHSSKFGLTMCISAFLTVSLR
jgi:hypothetical protein